MTAVIRADINSPEDVNMTPATIASIDPAAHGAAKSEKRKPSTKASSSEDLFNLSVGAEILDIISLKGVNIDMPKAINKTPKLVTIFSKLNVNRGIINSFANTPIRLYVIKLRVKPKEKRRLAMKALDLADFFADIYVKKVGRTGKRHGENATIIPAR